jgi:hypothetical protein
MRLVAGSQQQRLQITFLYTLIEDQYFPFLHAGIIHSMLTMRRSTVCSIYFKVLLSFIHIFFRMKILFRKKFYTYKNL